MHQTLLLDRVKSPVSQRGGERRGLGMEERAVAMTGLSVRTQMEAWQRGKAGLGSQSKERTSILSIMKKPNLTILCKVGVRFSIIILLWCVCNRS